MMAFALNAASAPQATFAAISPLMAAVTGEGSQNCERRASVVSRVREFAHAKRYAHSRLFPRVCLGEEIF
jgi:hypothetical protein